MVKRKTNHETICFQRSIFRGKKQGEPFTSHCSFHSVIMFSALKGFYIAWYSLSCWHCIMSFPHIELKIAEIDKTYEGQAEEHYPVTRQRYDDAHGNRSKGLSQVSECPEGPNRDTAGGTRIVKRVCHTGWNEKRNSSSPKKSHKNQHGKSL